MTSIVYMWIQIRFYRVDSEVSHSEGRRRELAMKYRVCSLFILTLALLVITGFVVNFLTICNPLNYADKT